MIRNGDVPKLRVYLMKLYMQASHRQYEANKELDAIARDPDNPEHQRKIEAAIRQQNVEENLEAAYENMPEAFGRICMLYVNVHINGNPIKAFVDSGAQMTIMSQQMAERMGILRLMDTRHAGMSYPCFNFYLKICMTATTLPFYTLLSSGYLLIHYLL